MNELPLLGLDGGNPLAFLASLGLLRVISFSKPHLSPRLSWAPQLGAHRPILHTAAAIDPLGFVGELALRLSALEATPTFDFKDDLSFSLEESREYLAGAARSSHDGNLRHAEFAAGFMGDVHTTESGLVEDTALRTMSGAGHQHFLKFMRNLMEQTGDEHLYKALFLSWRYDDAVSNMTMRWDPADDSRYALRWNDPSGDRERGSRGAMWGANRLAIEGLPLLPVMAGKKQLESTGFQTAGRRCTFWTWPIWNMPLELDSVRSLLALKAMQDLQPDRSDLAARGVIEIYRSQRLTVGKFRNFTRGLPA